MLAFTIRRHYISLLSTWLIAVVMLAMPPAFAAIQGDLGETSSGQILLRFTLTPSYQVSRVDDIVLQISNLDDDVSYKEKLCIRGSKNSHYNITASSDNNARFAVVNGAGKQIPYQVYFYDQLSTSNPDRLQPRERSRAYNVANSEKNCNGEDNSAIEVQVASDDLKQADAGEYHGILILTVGSL